MNAYLIRTKHGDKTAADEAQILDWLYQGRCAAGDFVYHQQSWSVVSELPGLARIFANRPELKIEKLVIYVAAPGPKPFQTGPFSVSEVRHKIASGEIGPSSWIFIEKDTEWRQVKAVKALKEAIPALPVEAPAAPVVAATPDELLGEEANEFTLDEAATLPEKKTGPATSPVNPFSFSAPKQESPSVLLDMGGNTSEQNNQIDTGVAYEETTKAISSLGLSAPEVQSMDFSLDTPPPPPTAAPSGPPKLPNSSPTLAPPPPAMEVMDSEPFDGVTAEISTDPVWLIKAGTSENAMGPFRFLEVIKFLEDGKLNKNDKISRVGSNRFGKILQQYEFNVKYTLENVVEGGIEKQKIFIRRRHPRVPYLADVQIQRHGQTIQATCVNISSGGILVEVAKSAFALGETLSVRILPGLIHQTISCDTLVIGKVPKIPPGYALKFKDLKQSDKEAIDFFVLEALKKEQQRAI